MDPLLEKHGRTRGGLTNRTTEWAACTLHLVALTGSQMWICCLCSKHACGRYTACTLFKLITAADKSHWWPPILHPSCQIASEIQLYCWTPCLSDWNDRRRNIVWLARRLLMIVSPFDGVLQIGSMASIPHQQLLGPIVLGCAGTRRAPEDNAVVLPCRSAGMLQFALLVLEDRGG